MRTNRSIESGQLPKHMAAARGADRSFMAQGKCRRGVTTLPMEAWTRERKDPPLQGEESAKWIALAVTICGSCPVQYDCCRFALQVGEKWGTWGVDIDDLNWMRRQGVGEAIVDAAEATEVSLTVMVQRARRMRT